MGTAARSARREGPALRVFPGACEEADLGPLLAGRGIAHDAQVLDLDDTLWPFAPIGARIERVLDVDEPGQTAALLRLRDRRQRERGFARAFRAVDFDDAAARQAADAERDVEPERAGRGRLDLGHRVVGAEAHDRALAELPLDLRERAVQRLLLVGGPLVVHLQDICPCHLLALLFHTGRFAAMHRRRRCSCVVPVMPTSCCAINRKHHDASGRVMPAPDRRP